MTSRVLLVVALALGGVSLFVAQAQQRTTAPAPEGEAALTALDYIEIQQLVNKYAFAIDTCANNGYDYADLYVSDGVFISGRTGARYEGRDALATAAGGGTRECRNMERMAAAVHTTVNLVIEPAPEGARGKSYLVYPGLRGEFLGPDNTGYVGGYEDVYVKTAEGWRFKSRIHVHPPQVPGAYSGVPNSELEPAPPPQGAARPR